MNRRQGTDRFKYFARWQLLPVILALPGHIAFVLRGFGRRTSPLARLKLAYAAIRIHLSMECGHNPMEAIHVLEEIIELSPRTPGVIVECGSFLGGSTSKLSLAAALMERRLIVCDSFEGLPEVNSADHQVVKRNFQKGQYSGRLDEVKANVRRFGRIEVVDFVKGWYDDTLNQLADTTIACAFWDVDLQKSFRSCLRFLWAQVQPGCKIFIHDVDRRPVIESFSDAEWWASNIGGRPPQVVGALTGLGRTSPLIGYISKN